jgi:hypothetical protein
MSDTARFTRDNANRLWQPLAPRTAAQFLSDEPDIVIVDRPSSLEKWGVRDTGRAGVEQFVLFEDAIEAAENIVTAAIDDSRESILRGLGVSEDKWIFEISDDYLSLTSTARADVCILASMEYPTWSLHVGEDIVMDDDQIAVVLRAAEQALSAPNGRTAPK